MSILLDSGPPDPPETIDCEECEGKGRVTIVRYGRPTEDCVTSCDVCEGSGQVQPETPNAEPEDHE